MKLFISYAHNEEDTKAALRLFRELKRFGLEPWIDSESIPAGGEWEIEINQAIRQCNYFIAVLSSNSVDRVGYIQKELREAISKLDEYPPGSIFIIPVRINTCYPRHPKLTTLQWVDMFPDWEMGLEKIKASIEIKNAIAFNDKKLLGIVSE
jgi:hypothetical protein